MAQERLSAAQGARAGGFPSSATSLAYYAMLYAARAALSEEDRYAKTHSGVWNLFGSSFVESGRFDRGLFDESRKVQRAREAADYDAAAVSAAQASSVVALAERFVTSVRQLVGE